MNFVRSNAADLQKAQFLPVHYIFCIDESGSMGPSGFSSLFFQPSSFQGSRWGNLMESLNKTLN